MSQKSFEDSPVENKGKQEDIDLSEKGTHASGPDKKLMYGMVQFYEDILGTLPDTFIAVFNNFGKFIEVWGNPSIIDDIGINPSKFKSKLTSDVFSNEINDQLLASIQSVQLTRKALTLRIQPQFPNGKFWFEVKLSSLQQSNDDRTVIVSHFQNITRIIQSEELRNEKKDNYALAQKSTDGYITVNNKGIVTSINESLQTISGFDPADFIGRKLSKIPILKHKDIPKFEAVLDTLYDGRMQESFELQWTDAKGQINWSEIQTSLLTRLNKITGTQVVFKNITEHKFIENDLMKSKQAYKVIIENAHEAIFVIQDNQIRFCNSRLLELLNDSLDNIINQDFLNIVYPSDKPSVIKYLRENILGKSTLNEITFRLNEQSGSFAWVKIKSVIIDWNGRPALLLFANDITEHKINEHKERQRVESIEFISEKAIEFGQLTEDYNVFEFVGKKINEITNNTAILLVSYDPIFNRTKIEHIEGSDDSISKISGIIRSNMGEFSKKLNHELIRDLSYGKLLKYNDGLFEFGYNFFPNNTFELIQNSMNVGSIYLIGLTYENNVFGTVLIFLQSGEKLNNPEAIETIAKLGSSALHRKNSWSDLKENKEKFHRIFESTQDIYFHVDIDGIILEVSPSAERISDFSPKDIIGRPVGNYFDPNFNVISILQTLLKERRISDRDIKLIKKDHSVLDASLNAHTLYDSNGKPTGFEGFIRDISSRKQIEFKYKKSEEKFRTLADFTYDWEYWQSPLGKIIYMSPSCERISGYSPNDFTKKPDLLLEITHPDDYDKYKNHIFTEEEENKNEVLKLDYRIKTKDGKTKWISHICQEVYDENEISLGRRVSSRDITERKEAEQELQNSEARFKTLFIGSPDAVFVIDKKSFILDVNPTACDLVKHSRNELIGKSILDLVPSEERKKVSKSFSKWVAGDITNYQGNTVTSEGEIIPIDVNGGNITYSNRDVMMCIVRDITDIIIKEERLKDIAKKAEEADMLKSAFLANVSHEIRTPMNAIVGFSEILTNQDLSKKEREEFINYITQGSNTLMNLIEDIIDITKIEAGQIKIDFSECEVSNLLDELYATFLKMKNQNGKSAVDLRLNKPITGDDFTILTDPMRIRQILSNLLGNALKFTKKGFIEFGIDLTKHDTIDFYVKDTGAGIQKDKLDLIFERFGQADDSKKNNPKGTGLGLAISIKLAELLGGNLTVESVYGEGSTFTLSLPLNSNLIQDDNVEKPLIGHDINWSNKVFLIAEDSILNYTFLEALLQRTKVKLKWAKNGKEAVEMCLEDPNIDLVLMDIKMPLLDGLEAIAQIKQARKELPIIVQTAYAMVEDQEKSIQAGANEHLTKPLNPEKLFGAITKVFPS